MYFCDVKVVFQFIRNNVTDLTHKLAILALVSALRASIIHHLNIKFVTIKNNKVIFHFYELQNSWRKRPSLPAVYSYSFHEELELHVVKILDEYLERVC